MKDRAAFWDTSAIVPLLVNQAATQKARQFSRRYRRVVVWWGALIEAHNAIGRLARDGLLGEKARSQAVSLLSRLRSSWLEVQPTEDLRELAISLVEKYQLRSADLVQLASALVWCNNQPRRRPFVCFDDGLARAATVAGFEVFRL
ncbi:MAG TPA: type II toxin-antitoxin system VapC family toxin [Blastocatellia bacterium]|nr:type II toxin-antitoxin system VapC family toxin [Blastocatellia bacterium]